MSPPCQAPLRHPSHLSQIAQWKEKIFRGIGREHWEPLKYKNWSHKRHANRVMNTLQAHGMTTYKLTQNTAGQSQPQDSHSHMTAANAMTHTDIKQTLKHSQDIGQCLQRMSLTRLPPDHNSVHSDYIKMLQNASRWHQTLADCQNANTTCKRKCYWPAKLLVFNCVKFHLTILKILSIITCKFMERFCVKSSYVKNLPW